MSEGYWLFTLKMIIQALWKKDFSFQVISAKCEDCSKAKIVNNWAWRPKMKRNKGTYFTFCNFKSFRKQSGLTYLNFGLLGRDIDDVCFSPIFMFGWNLLLGKSLFPTAYIVISKVNPQHPLDIIRFLGEINVRYFQCPIIFCPVIVGFPLQWF